MARFLVSTFLQTLLFGTIFAVSVSFGAEYVAEIDAESCTVIGDGVCRTVKDPWEQKCADYHSRQGDLKGATHYTVTSMEPGNNVLFIGTKSVVRATYLDCGENGQPAVGSPLHQEQIDQEQQKLWDKRLAFGGGLWKKKTSIDAITDDASVRLTLSSMSGATDQGNTMSLIVRCDPLDLSLSVDWGTFVSSSDHAVTDRLGDGLPMTRKWEVLGEFETTRHPIGMNVIRHMVFEDKYAVRTTPVGEAPVTILFDVRGLASALGEHRKVCGI